MMFPRLQQKWGLAAGIQTQDLSHPNKEGTRHLGKHFINCQRPYELALIMALIVIITVTASQPWVGIYFCLKSPSLACAGRAHSIAFCQVLPRGPPLTPADFSPPLLPPLKWKAVSPLAWSAVIPSNWVLLVRAASPVSLRNELSFNLFFWII